MATPARVKQIRERLGLSQFEFREKTGLPQSTVSLIESGARTIGKSVADRIITSLNINRRWWISGEGEMFIKSVDRSIPVFSFDDIDGLAIDSLPETAFSYIDRIVEYTGQSFGKVTTGSQLLLKMTTAFATPENSVLVIVMTKGASAIGHILSHNEEQITLQQNSTPFTVKKRGIKQIYRVEWVVVKT